ncbi:NitT/TauT family transport system permease protein [Ancylobacter aquaticus]|uniref:NitT/TauT family transport system permease protein n=1 Tax=Ancylobacter aquaticus TaxID=100 RepID=A0A4R1I653_ANCAQ|nr:ABC transporter permease [Ancylobacter aquaticus]TCK30844.1 NitT/TauT family transport system permease protein [Ancylobacter aquaticus]
MSDTLNHAPADPSSASPPPSTVWKEKQSWLDVLPTPVAMAMLVAIFVAIWQAIHLSGLVSPIILPSPARTGAELITVGANLLSGGFVFKAFLVTAQEVVFGFAMAIVIGVTLGIVVGETHFGERAVMPLIVAIDTMPKIAFAPVFVAWLGFGIASKVALAAFVAIFPIVVGVAAGLHAADENSRMMFRSIGASRWQTLRRLKIPAGLPQFFTGLKIAAIGVVAGAITGEFLGGGRGFGDLIRTAASQLDTARVFALIFYLSLLGLATYWCVVLAERRMVFWRRTNAVAGGGR